MYINRKKELIKSGLIIGFILLIAVVSTHYIYYKFQNERNVDYNSESLDIVFHDKDGAFINIDKINPLTDSVGLSSKSYTFTIKNNLTEPVKYLVTLSDDIEKIVEDNCGDALIDKNYIKVSIKEDGSKTQIYTLAQLQDNVLDKDKIKALDTKNYSVRVWVSRDIPIPAGTKLHYHGVLKVVEE